MTLENIRSDFALLDDWEDRYRYVIELGRALPPLPEALRTDANKVRGCASQVWLATQRPPQRRGRARSSTSQGDSDAHIVRGLIAILFALFDGKTARGDPAHRRARRSSRSWGSRSTSRRSARTASSPWSSASATTHARSPPQSLGRPTRCMYRRKRMERGAHSLALRCR